MKTDSSMFVSRYDRMLWWISVFVILVTIGLTAFRIVYRYDPPGVSDWNRKGLCDFHNGIYFPANALMEGVSPYGEDYPQQYPVPRPLPFFLPSILVLHLPFAWLPLHASEVLYFLFSVCLTGYVSYYLAKRLFEEQRLSDTSSTLSLKTVSAMIFAGTLLTRGGHITLFNGYFTFELVLAAFVAIDQAKKRSWLSGIALAIVAVKPTFLLPLGFLLLAQGRIRALCYGAVLTIVTGFGPMLYLAYQSNPNDLGQGVSTMVEQIQRTQEIHRAEESESPTHSWTRIDMLAAVCKWLQKDPSDFFHLAVMMLFVIPAMVVLAYRAHDADDQLFSPATALITTTIATSVYHQFYDALILLPAIIATLIPTKSWRRVSPLTCRLIALGLAIPLLNYFSTRSILLRIESSTVVAIITSLNAGVLFVVWLAVMRCAALPFEQDDPSQENETFASS